MSLERSQSEPNLQAGAVGSLIACCGKGGGLNLLRFEHLMVFKIYAVVARGLQWREA